MHYTLSSRSRAIMYQKYPSFLAPQTEIPLTGEMSRSDKRVTARYEQLEPVTLNMLSATVVASLYRYDKTIHRIVLSATDNSTRSVTAIRCRRRENCAEVPTETKRPHIMRSFCLAPQTEIPLTGEMSLSDKRVTARYEQLEPVTLNMLSATAVASLYRYDKTIHRIVLSATDNSRVPLLQYGVAGERTAQRCRQKQKDRSMSDLLVWRLKQRFP